jgi:RHS repeat-associated protein
MSTSSLSLNRLRRLSALALLALSTTVTACGGQDGGGTTSGKTPDAEGGEGVSDAGGDAGGDGTISPPPEADAAVSAPPDAARPEGDGAVVATDAEVPKDVNAPPPDLGDDACRLDTDCPDPTFCAADGTCFPGCRQNPDNCGEGQVCDGNHICVPRDVCLDSEICANGLDDDCDGLTDQDDGECGAPCVADAVCETGVPGECSEGRTRCLDGPVGPATCIGVRDPAPAEVCDTADNDCDGEVDEDFPTLGAPCSAGTGACQTPGTLVCGPAGDAVVCSARPGAPSAETCNGLDDDCNGVVDDGFDLGGACVVGEGICAVQGERACAPDGRGTICVGEPGAAGVETCNGLDDDCDGEADEDYPDLNSGCGVGLGVCASGGIRVCAEDGRSTRCNGVAQAPGVETCNGLDDDCDGLTDEDDNGEPISEVCYEGPAGSQAFGRCREGARVCRGGRFGACEGQVLPGAESCNGLDDDCDGTVDLDGGGEPLLSACYDGPDGTAGRGLCRSGTAACVNGAPGPCVGQIVPQNEICDARDNDCDGRTDDLEAGQGCACRVGDTRACYSGARLSRGVGICTDGVQSCLPDGTGWGPCDGEVLPQAEQCNGLDDNCNGEVDDSIVGVGLDCTVGLGICARSSLAVCDPAQGVICPVEAGQPEAEACDNQDDDCDGRVDEDFGVGLSCTRGLGICRRVGVTRCNAQGVPACSAVVGPAGVEVCDQLDNDCDGAVDDGFNIGANCSVGTGECRRAGHLVCTENGDAGCDATPAAPAPERCDALDNDCDGTADDGFALGAVCQRGVGQCAEAGTLICGGNGLATCSVPGGFGHEEVCNGLDDDCDGVADNDVPVGRPCETGRPGPCNPGHVLCEDAAPACVSDVLPSAEVCDGIDNDCNGAVDNGFGQTTCGVGACRHSVNNCQGGRLVVCDPMEGAGPELCNGLDDDCDGQIDENPTDANIPCAAGVGACTRLGRVVCAAGQRRCDAVPAAPTPELCDLEDNDCDGEVDEDALGTERTCSAGVGACAREAGVVCELGLLTCPAEAAAPGEEVCNGLDDDCDGLLDEGFGSTVCGLGACRHAVPNCAGGPPPVCDPFEGRSAEICNGIDDDCDGVVDDAPTDVGAACVSGRGACQRAGLTVCQGGVQVCGATPGPAAEETCNLVDDDCDGEFDEGPVDAGAPCSAGVGQCRQAGATVCRAGTLSCNAVAGAPRVEICDELDNDCDGEVDDGFDPVTCGVGICRHTVNNCFGGGPPACDPMEGARAETCNGLDDDCDGQVDDAPADVGEACSAGVGVCARNGVTVCRNGREACGAVPGAAVAEICDDLDNDCDGDVDEGGVCPDRTPPVVTIDLSLGVADVGQPVTITVGAADDSPVDVEVLVNGAPLPLDGNGQAVFTPQRAGSYTITVTVTDALGNETVETATLLVRDPADNIEPQAALEGPNDLAEITVPTVIRGSVGDANFYRYRLFYAPAGDGTPAGGWIEFARGTEAVVSGPLGTIDPTGLENGMYRVLLIAEDANGNEAQDIRTFSITGDAKVGLFTLTYTDASVPVAGMPLTVERTYDSRVKSVRDFGVGWTLSVKQGKFEHSRAMDQNWQVRAGGFLGLPCQTSSESAAHTTELRLGDRERYVFRPTLTPGGIMLGACQISVSYEPVYSSMPGRARLDILSGTTALFLNGEEVLVTDDFLEPFTIDAVRLTTPDGRVFDFSRDADGVFRVEDRNDNAITIARNGLIHSTGKNVEFVRDGQGRVTAVVMPNGSRIRYGYNAAGDLETVTDELGAVTRYRYDARHNLVQIIDPSGRTPTRQEYDEKGKLVALVYPDGTRVAMDSDTAARVEVVRDRLGNVEIMEYDTLGNVTRRTDKRGARWTYTYDAQGRKTAETDPDGNTSFIAYDAIGYQNRVTNPLGHATRLEYDAAGELLRQTEPGGAVTAYTYDERGNRLTETDPDGNVTRFTYDAKGLMLTKTDALGRVWRWTYDNFGNTLTETEPSGRVRTNTYDASFNRLTETTTWTGPDGPTTLTTRYTYDARNRIVATEDPLGGVMRVEYDTRGFKTAEIDAEGRRTTLEYDSLGNLVRKLFADGTAESYAYDAENRRISTTDRGGRTVRQDYDATGNLSRLTQPDGGVVQKTYDSRGNLVRDVDARGNARTFEYDAANRKTATVDAVGRRTTYAYDADGLMTSMVGPDGEVWRYEYDRRRNRTAIVRPDGQRKSWTYDAGGRKVTETDEAGNTTRFEHDVMDRLITVTDALGNATRHTYDELGNRTSTTDANGRVTRMTYDALGRIVARELPGGQVEGLEYDRVGNVIRKVDYNGAEIHFTYDESNRLIERLAVGGEMEQATFTASGKRDTVTTDWGDTRYTYDVMDRTTSRTDPDGVTLRWTWDANGNRLSQAGPSGTTRYGYDALDRLITVTAPDGAVTRYTYDAAGNVSTMEQPGGFVTTYTYDRLRRLTQVRTVDAQAQVVAEYRYTLGRTGVRTRVVETHTGRTLDYTYDNLFRLTREVVTVGGGVQRTIDYGYDAVGNRVLRNDSVGGRAVFLYDENDRLLSVNRVPYVHDDNGQLIAQGEGADLVVYGWDTKGRMVSVARGGGTVDFRYDTDGHRVERFVTDAQGNEASARYVIDDTFGLAQAVAELDGAGAVTTGYVFGLDVLSQRRGATTTHFLLDGQGSVRQAFRGGAVTDTFTYDAFGRESGRTGATPIDLRFGGQFVDANVGFHYMRARWYDSEGGRFVSPDPVEGLEHDPRTLHRYTYAGNDPVNMQDYNGKFLAGVMVGMSIQSSLRSMYTTFLIKFFLNTLKVAYCLLKPAYETREQGMEMIMNDMRGGDEQMQLGQQQIAFAYFQIAMGAAKAAIDVGVDGIKKGIAKVKEQAEIADAEQLEMIQELSRRAQHAAPDLAYRYAKAIEKIELTRKFYKEDIDWMGHLESMWDIYKSWRESANNPGDMCKKAEFIATVGEKLLEFMPSF